MAKVYHAFAMTARFFTHASQVTGTRVSEIAVSQRGQSIGWESFPEVLRHVLQPLADPAPHAAAFQQQDRGRGGGVEGGKEPVGGGDPGDGEVTAVREAMSPSIGYA